MFSFNADPLYRYEQGVVASISSLMYRYDLQ
jgi:hypothetical protein